MTSLSTPLHGDHDADGARHAQATGSECPSIFQGYAIQDAAASSSDLKSATDNATYTHHVVALDGDATDDEQRALLLQSDSEEVVETSKDTTAEGLAWYAFSSIFFALMGICSKQLGRLHYTVWEILLVRAVVIIPICVSTSCFTGKSLRGNRPGWLLLRGSLGFGSITCFFLACQRLPLADAVTFTFLAPLVAAVLAPAMLKERISGATIVAIIACIAGVLLVAQPDFLFGRNSVELDVLGLTVACLQPLFSATAKMTVRHLRNCEDTNVMVLYLMYCTFAYASVACVFTWREMQLPTGAMEWALLVGQGLFGYGNQICITIGLAKAKAAQAMSMQYLSIVVSQIAGMLLFGEFTSVLGDVGMTVILTTMITYSVLESRTKAKA